MGILAFPITSGTINMDSMRDFFGPPETFGTGVIPFSWYYRGGNYIPDITENNAVATSGTISLGSIRGTSVDVDFDTLKILSNVITVSSGSSPTMAAAWEHDTPWAPVSDVGDTITSTTVSGSANGSYVAGISPRNGFAMKTGGDALAEYYITVSNTIGVSTSPITATVTTVNNGNSSSSSAWGNWSVDNDFIVVSAAFSNITSTTWSGVTVVWYGRKQGYNSVTESQSVTCLLQPEVPK